MRRALLEFRLDKFVTEKAASDARRDLTRQDCDRRAALEKRQAEVRDALSTTHETLFGDDADPVAVCERLAQESSAYYRGDAASVEGQLDRLGLDDAAPAAPTNREARAAAFQASSWRLLEPLAPVLLFVFQQLVLDRCVNNSDVPAHLAWLLARAPAATDDTPDKVTCRFCSRTWTSARGARGACAHVCKDHIHLKGPRALGFFPLLVGDGFEAYELPETTVVHVFDYATATPLTFLDAYVVPKVLPALITVFGQARAHHQSDATEPLDLVAALRAQLPQAPAAKPPTRSYLDALVAHHVAARDDLEEPPRAALVDVVKFLPALVITKLVGAADPAAPLAPAQVRDRETLLTLNAGVNEDLAHPEHRELTPSVSPTDRFPADRP